jgi:hypothetical protein
VMLDVRLVAVGGEQTKVVGSSRVGGCGKVMFEARSFARASSKTCELRSSYQPGDLKPQS